jgi:hypothetical protein
VRHAAAPEQGAYAACPFVVVMAQILAGPMFRCRCSVVSKNHVDGESLARHTAHVNAAVDVLVLALVADRSRVVTSTFLNHSTVDDGARSELLSLLTTINDGFTAARRAPDEVAKDEL